MFWSEGTIRETLKSWFGNGTSHFFKSQTPLINFSKACEERRVELQALLVDAHVL